MKKAFALILFLLILVFSKQMLGQSSNASLSGTVTDVSGGVIPNVTVTATNNATGVVSTVVSNAAGVYNFPSLLPGAYKISAKMFLQNPLPGTRGKFGFNRFYYAGSWNADMAISKSIHFGESRGVQFRVDAKNIFNHPRPGTYTALTPGSPSAYAGTPAMNLSAGSTYAGDISSKVGQRTFQARIRLNF